MANNANVRFLRGTQTKLKSLSSYVEGAFYLTDEDRLYFAKSASDLAYLNKSITTVDKAADLFALANPIAGEFYYVKDGNILCYYSATEIEGEPNVNSNGQWIQVNVDNDVKISKIDVSDAVLSADGKSLEMTCTVIRTDREDNEVPAKTDEEGNPIEQLSTVFKITGEQINSFVEKVTVDVSITSPENSTAINLGGQGTGSVELVEGDHITLDGSVKDQIKISAQDTTYIVTNVDDDEKLTTQVILKSQLDDTTTAVKFAESADNDDIELIASTDTITVKHKDYDDIDKKGSNAISSGKFKALTGLTTENGHVTAVEEKEFELPKDVHASAVTANNSGKIVITLNDETEVSSGEVLYYTIADAQGTEVKHYNQSSLTNSIKNLIQKNFTDITNAMTFKGAIRDGVVPTTNVAIGDTYIIKTVEASLKDNTTLEETANIGDIIIANGTETNGVITSDLEWIVVQGNEKDTEYLLKTTNDNEIILVDKDNSTAVSTIQVIDDNIVNLSTVATVETVDGKETTIYKLKGEHANVTRVDNPDDQGQEGDPAEETLAHNGSFTVVTGVSSNAQGHITGMTSTTFTLPDNPDQTNNHSLANGGTETAPTHVTVLLNSDDTECGRFQIKGDADSPNTGKIIKVTPKINSTGKGTNYTVEHKAYTVAPSAAAVSLDHSVKNIPQTFTAITQIDDDGYGHVTGIQTTTYTMPDENVLGCDINNTTVTVDSVNYAGVSVQHQLVSQADTVVSSVTDKYVSLNENIKISTVATGDEKDHVIGFNLQWGSF